MIEAFIGKKYGFILGFFRLKDLSQKGASADVHSVNNDGLSLVFKKIRSTILTKRMQIVVSRKKVLLPQSSGTNSPVFKSRSTALPKKLEVVAMENKALTSHRSIGSSIIISSISRIWLVFVSWIRIEADLESKQHSFWPPHTQKIRKIQKIRRKAANMNAISNQDYSNDHYRC